MAKHPPKTPPRSSLLRYVLGGAGVGSAVLLGIWAWKRFSSASQAAVSTPLPPSAPPPAQGPAAAPPPATAAPSTSPPPAAPTALPADGYAAYLAGYTAFSSGTSVQQALAAWEPTGGAAVADSDLFVQGWLDRQQGLPPRYAAPAGTTPPDQDAAAIAALSAKVTALQTQQNQTQATVQQQGLSISALGNVDNWNDPGTQASANLLVVAANAPNGPALIQSATAVYQATAQKWSAYVNQQNQQNQQTAAAAVAALTVTKAISTVAAFIPLAGGFINACLSIVNTVLTSIVGQGKTWTSPEAIPYGWINGCYWMDWVPILSWMVPRGQVAIGQSAAQLPQAGPPADWMPSFFLPTPGNPLGPGDAMLRLCTTWPFGPPVPWCLIMWNTYGPGSGSPLLTDSAYLATGKANNSGPESVEIFYAFPTGDMSDADKLLAYLNGGNWLSFQPPPDTSFFEAWGGVGTPRTPVDRDALDLAIGLQGIKCRLALVTDPAQIVAPNPNAGVTYVAGAAQKPLPWPVGWLVNEPGNPAVYRVSDAQGDIKGPPVMLRALEPGAAQHYWGADWESNLHPQAAGALDPFMQQVGPVIEV